MKHVLLGCALLLSAQNVVAKDKPIPLAPEDASALMGKTVALTTHERPSFTAMTAGKAGFGLFGAGAMIAAGNKLVDENGVADPAILVREQLSVALRDAYGVQLLATDATPTKATKPKELAALHPASDYVFDVRSGGWMHAYYPTKWGSYWVGYSVQVQLIDTKTARQVTNMACNANTQQNPNPPSREALTADGAQLLKDVTAGLGWVCVHLLAKEQLRFPEGKVATTPAQYVDPLAAHAVSGGKPAAADAPAAAVAPESSAAATAADATTPAPSVSDAPADTQAPTSASAGG